MNADDLSNILLIGTWALVALALLAKALGLKQTAALCALGGLLVIGAHAYHANSLGALTIVIPMFILGVLLVPWQTLKN